MKKLALFDGTSIELPRLDPSIGGKPL